MYKMLNNNIIRGTDTPLKISTEIASATIDNIKSILNVPRETVHELGSPTSLHSFLLVATHGDYT